MNIRDHIASIIQEFIDFDIPFTLNSLRRKIQSKYFYPSDDLLLYHLDWAVKKFQLSKSDMFYFKERNNMNNLHLEVLNQMMILFGQRQLFTAYDITRILRVKDRNVTHDDVRSWVEFYYKQVGLERTIGYHLPYSPSPQIYHTKNQDILKYDPDALDPNKEVKVTTKEAKAATIPVQTEYWYALIHKPSGERVTPYKGNKLGLYRTRNGPKQLMISQGIYSKDYEIIKYEVLLKPVGA